jgi:hypothetical protein
MQKDGEFNTAGIDQVIAKNSKIYSKSHASEDLKITLILRGSFNICICHIACYASSSFSLIGYAPQTSPAFVYLLNSQPFFPSRLWSLHQFLPNMADTGAQCYMTLVMSDSYLPGAMVLGHSLRDTGTTRNLVALVTLDTVSLDVINELKVSLHYYVPYLKNAC